MKRFQSLFLVCMGLLLALPAQAAGISDLEVGPPQYSNGLTLELNWKVDGEMQANGLQVQRHPEGSNEWESTGDPLGVDATTFEDGVPETGTWTYRLVAVNAEGQTGVTVGPSAAGTTKGTWLNTNPAHMMLLGLIALVGTLMTIYTKRAQRGEEIYIRRIPGIDAIEEGIGRATEMGKPVLYVPGIDDLQDIQTIASMLILGQVSKTVAEYQADLIVSCCVPIVREVADEVVRAGYYQAGHPDAYNAANIRFISSEQFAFCAGTNGIMLREKPSTNIYFGRFFAESLILAETGFVNRSIQIAGTAEATQLPFFIAACDYTLIGEELFAVSAYLSKDPRLVSSLKASDIVKAICVAALIIGTVLASFDNTFLIDLFKISGSAQVKRTIPLIVSFIIGMMMVGEFFIPHHQYRAVTNEFLEWGLILSAGAFLLGLVNLVQVNLPKVQRKEEDWQYKAMMLVALVVTLFVGFSGGTARQEAGFSYKWFFDYVFVPLNATMFALLAFYIASAAFRAFRARNLEATVLLSAAILVMIARVPLGESIPVLGDYLPRLMNWIMDIPNTAARRAIFIGAALGAIATGLRVILGMERSHLGGGDA